MGNPPQAVFFDAAGTLIRLRRPAGEVYLRHAQQFGLDRLLSQALFEQAEASFRKAFDRHVPLLFPRTTEVRMKRLEREWWREVVRETLRGVAEVRDFVRFFDSLYNLYGTANAWELEPGCREVLSGLVERSVRVVVVSNFDSRLPGLLRALGITDLLSGIVFSTGTGFAKPDPGIFRVALETVALEKHQCCHVGDSLRDDFEGAASAGIRSFLYDPRLKHRRMGQERVASLQEVVDILFRSDQ